MGDDGGPRGEIFCGRTRHDAGIGTDAEGGDHPLTPCIIAVMVVV